MHDVVIEPLVRTALLEDIGHGADLTTDAIVPEGLALRALVRARTSGTVAGHAPARLAFHLLHPRMTYAAHVADGAAVQAGTVVAEVSGSARAVLTGERTALNFLCRLSGIATATRELVQLIAGTSAQVVCTRKTTPGLRVLEKAAVRSGGGSNHRFGLDDAVLIKDNHLAIAGDVAAAVAAVRSRVGHMVKIQLEVDTLGQLREALDLPIDAVLLDNMAPVELAQAVEMVDGRLITEASGNVSSKTIAAIARTGVDLISCGWLTHSAPALDLGLDIEE